MFCAGQFLTEVAAGLVRVGLDRDVADGAAFGARAIEGALRATQHLDAVDVDQPGLRIALVAGDRDDGYFVDVGTNSGIAHGGADAADRDVVLPGAVGAVVVSSERHARHEAGDVLVAVDVQIGELLALDDADAHGYVLGVLEALVGRDDDLLQFRGGVRAAELRVSGAGCRGADQQRGPGRGESNMLAALNDPEGLHSSCAPRRDGLLA